jgi:hypothetical protein
MIWQKMTSLLMLRNQWFVGAQHPHFPLHAIIIPDECSTQPLWQPKQLNNKEFVAVP